MNNSTPDPVALAREVLDDAQCLDALPMTAIVARTQAMISLAEAAPALARAVLRVEALADRLENEAAYEASRGDDWDAVCIRAEARRIRTDLNGETQ